MKFFARLSHGYDSMTAYELIEANSEEEALEEAYRLAVENAESYGFQQDEEAFGDLDTVGVWDEDSESYEEQGFLDYSVELYYPAEHDGYLN